MAHLELVIFTFTENEATAVGELLNSLLNTTADPSCWHAEALGSEIITGTLANEKTARIEHKPLRAQGNVTAAAELARVAHGSGEVGDHQADYYIFYGCCGALEEELLGRAFRVSRVAYLSLGTVSRIPPSETGGAATETVRLKNKWIVRTDPDNQPPLSSIHLPAGSSAAPGVHDAFVLATDKVIKVPPASDAPQPSWEDVTGPVYDQDEWTYGQALAHCNIHVPGPLLIDMETFGIASIMRAMGLDERVVVLRVVTDTLSNKEGQADGEQLDILRGQLPVLAEALTTTMGIADDTT